MSREQYRLTRRDVLRGAAVAGAVALVDPGAGLARARPAGLFSRSVGLFSRSVGLFSRSVGALPAGQAISLLAPRPFSLVGVEWRAPAAAQIELRTRVAGGDWGPWAIASVQGHGPDQPAPSDRRFGEPIWVGTAREVQLRSPERVAGVRVHFVSAGGGDGAGAGSGLGGRGVGGARLAQTPPLAQPVLEAGPGQPPIIARAGWAQGHAPPGHAPEYGAIKLAFVHHSETPNGYSAAQVPAILFTIFAFHRYVRGYFDIGYNFAIDRFGRVWEARAGGIDLPVNGAHAGGYNAESTGVVVLGSFMSAPASAAALAALESLLAWKLSLHGIPAAGRVGVEVSPYGAVYTAFAPGAHVSLPRIAGHRDGDQTSCPGDALYAQLPAVRSRVAGAVGSPARLTIVGPLATSAAVAPGTVVSLSGVLSDLATGAPIAGATIELQQITGVGAETTLATATTDATGAWTASLTAAQNLLVRALQPSAPAAVSDVVAITVAPVLTLSVESMAPLTVSGTVAPPGPRVTIDVYRVAGAGRRRFVASRAVGAAGGSFQARVKHPGPGRYVLIARTPASARFAAGASPPVAVTLG